MDAPFKKIYYRLGYHKNTKISFKQQKNIDEIINTGIIHTNLKGIYNRLKIISKKEDILKLDNGIVWNSSSVCSFLQGCEEVFLIGVTSDRELTEYRDKLGINNDTYSSVIIDAVGSEMTEAGAEYLHDFLKRILLKEGKITTKNRFSPGYGDLKLSEQKNIYESLQLNKINISLTDSFMLIPEKSITAIIGIKLL